MLNVSETCKGGIETFMDSIHKSKEVDNFFLLPEYKESILNFNKRSSRTFTVLHLFFLIFFKLKPSDYDLIYLHSTFAGLLRFVLYPLSFFYGYKVAYCSHGWSWNMTNKRLVVRRLYVFIEYVLAWFSHMVICISSPDFNSAKKYHIKNAILIQNGVRKSSVNLSQKPEFSFKFLFVGRLDYQKGLDKLINTLNELSLAHKITLTVIGERVSCGVSGEYNLPESTNKNVELIFVGWIENEFLDSFYFNNDITIIPSRYEGFGLVAVESLRNGTPVIASNKGALPTIINDSVGWIYDIDSSAELDSVLSSLNDNSVRIRSDKCREYFERYFDEKVMNDKYAVNFNSLCGKS